MPEKTQLLLYNPCHEQWDAMQPAKEGRFCGSCQKTVVDFTSMSDQELLAWFARGRSNVCGRMTEDQLNRELVPAPMPKKRVWAIWWQLLVAGLLVSSEASSQVKPPKPPITRSPNDNGRRPLVMGKMALLPPDQVIRVIDSATQQPLPGASVQLDDDPKLFVADSAGRVVIPYRRIAHASVLKVSSIGYGHAVVPVEGDWAGMDKVVTLASQSKDLLPVTVRAYSGSTLTGRAGGLVACVRVKRTWTKVIKDTLLCRKSPLTLYPNPVTRGASMTLSLRMDRPGTYMAQLYSAGGVVVESMKIEGVEGARTELMNIPGTVAAGVYFVRVFHLETGKMYTEKVVVL
jgi:hypothetical protein